MISGQKNQAQRKDSYNYPFIKDLLPGVIIPMKNRKRSQTSTLQNNNNPQGTQYNRKKVKELVSYGEAIA
ncbi:hypothetical protein ACPOM7_27320 [Peribacillus castrilensis]|uniref:Uncharacterized protein n=1 Tax=Peribacillus simplex TaxID=1478 RepID=A0AAN2PK80_9BACI|nr:MULTISPECIES: hypothetical protein [Bacillaceae]MCF7622040.1 hypothetical protein [Peribacillus frigoritolerans]MCT1391249.1 hypothetical protein [Peribacillus frigoritolerans]PRA79878.1 hypothetical protein CQ056_22030 [Peribacillus simplex]CEG33200.1 hypothetical protein BN1180_03372 [Peribacillus simplex]